MNTNAMPLPDIFKDLNVRKPGEPKTVNVNNTMIEDVTPSDDDIQRLIISIEDKIIVVKEMIDPEAALTVYHIKANDIKRQHKIEPIDETIQAGISYLWNKLQIEVTAKLISQDIETLKNIYYKKFARKTQAKKAETIIAALIDVGNLFSDSTEPGKLSVIDASKPEPEPKAESITQEDIAKQIMTAIAPLFGKNSGADLKEIEKALADHDTRLIGLTTNSKIITKRIDDLENNKPKTVKLEITKPDKTTKTLGTTHYLTERVLQTAQAIRTDEGALSGIYLCGPAGTGKSHCARQVAEALDLDFYPMSVGPQTSKSDLLGYKDAQGNYHSTPLANAFKNGGLFLLDEIDAGNPAVLTILNSALANGVMAFPNGITQRHKDFLCIATANTYGSGATRAYVGRNPIDAATLDRFIYIDFGYDEGLEASMSVNQAFTQKIQAIRTKANEIGAKAVISPRATMTGSRLVKHGFSVDLALDMVVWSKMDHATRKKLENA